MGLDGSRAPGLEKPGAFFMAYSGAPVLRAGSCWGCVWRAALGLPQTVVNVVERGCNAAVAVNQVVEVPTLELLFSQKRLTANRCSAKCNKSGSE